LFDLVVDPFGNQQGVGAGGGGGTPPSGLIKDGQQALVHRQLHGGVFAAVDGQQVGVLGWIVPVSDLDQCLSAHGVDQLTKQGGDVTQQARLDGGVLNPAVFHGVVEGANVLVGPIHTKICVLGMEQFMHHITSVFQHQRTADHCFIFDPRQVQLVVAVDPGGLYVFRPDHMNPAKVEGLSGLVGEGLKTESELEPTHGGAGENGFDVHKILTGIG